MTDDRQAVQLAEAVCADTCRDSIYFVLAHVVDTLELTDFFSLDIEELPPLCSEATLALWAMAKIAGQA